MGALAGCAAGTADAAGNGGGSSVTGPYADGTYTEDGSYLSPAGEQTVTVKLTMAADKITAITVTPHATDPTAEQYQAMFAQGVGALVVGKDIDQLSVSRVAGSSLTSGGFNKAIAAIKAAAKA
jgi:FMN-binding domain.